jgi:hypothetical protein
MAGPAQCGYVVTNLVASRKATGRGEALMRTLQHRWVQQGAIAALSAATPALVHYYRRLG